MQAIQKSPDFPSKVGAVNNLVEASLCQASLGQASI